MGVLGDLTQGLTDAYEGAKAAIQGNVLQPASDATGLSNTTVPGVQLESSGTTTTGGKMGGRRRRTRRSKKSKKTLRRRK